MSDPAENTSTWADNALIVGCGFLGRPLATRLIQRGVCVYGTTRSTEQGQKLAGVGIRPLLMEVTQPLTLAALKPALEAPQLDVFYLVPPSRPGRDPSPRQVVIQGMTNMIEVLGEARVRSAIMTSSTAVYGQTQGQRVDADTPPDPIDQRGHLLLEGEQLWLNSGLPAKVLRLAGLYGPDRAISLSAVRQGAPIVGDPNVLLNLIFVDDAVELLLAMNSSPETESGPKPGKVELGCDGQPVKRIEYYQFLAEKLGVPMPPVLDDAAAAEQMGLDVQRLRRLTSKACDPGPTCSRTGWKPGVVSYREGIDAILAAQNASKMIELGISAPMENQE